MRKDVMQRGSGTNGRTVRIGLAGDVGPCRPDPASIFRFVAPALREHDAAFCQLEPALTRRGEPMPQARLAMRAPPESAAALREAGFHVVSCAGNHCLDFGVVGLEDTVRALRAAGLATVGTGMDLAAARRPTYVHVQDTRVAFLAYSAILPMNYAAAEHRPGAAPLRAWTRYEQIEHDQPGTPARVHTFPHREDLAAMAIDIEAARSQADRVVVSIHWGVHFVPGELAAYQRAMAHAAIDAGAAIVVGHHPHVLKAIEVYRGAPILYSLGNFALDPPTAFADNLRDSRGFQEIQSLTSFWDARTLLPPDTRLSLLASWHIAKSRTVALELLPVFLNEACDPTLPTRKEAAFDRVVEYLDFTCTSQDLAVPYVRHGDRLRIDLA